MPKIPDFKTAEEEAEFWETHSVSDYWDEFEPVKVELNPKLKAKIKARANLKRVTLRLSQEQIAAAKRIAAKKGIPYQTLMRMWIVEGINAQGDGLAKGSDDIYPASGDIGQLPGRCVEEMEDTEVSIGIQTKAPDEGSDTVSIQTYHEAKDDDYKPYEGGFPAEAGSEGSQDGVYHCEHKSFTPGEA